VTEEMKNPNGDNQQEEPTTEEAAEEAESTSSEAPDEQQVLRKQLEATHDRLLRTAAELDNLRKRAKRDIEDALIRGRTEVLQEILPVIDSVDLALTSTGPESVAESIIEGVKMIQKQFLAATSRFQLKAVETAGKAFDPNYHEAVAQIASPDHAAGQIVNEMRKGYLLGDRLIRPSMVVVSKGSGEKTPSSAGAEEDSATGNDEASVDAAAADTEDPGTGQSPSAAPENPVEEPQKASSDDPAD
jgi:molecular chaperone GrpE